MAHSESRYRASVPLAASQTNHQTKNEFIVNEKKRPPCGNQVQELTFITPVGPLYVWSCSRGLHQVTIRGDTVKFEAPSKDARGVELIAGEHDQSRWTKHAQVVHQWLKKYFENPSLTIDDPLPEICNFDKFSSFYQQVWNYIASSVKVGQTASYGEVAKALGKPNAARAVGTAMKNNCICLMIPCHRIVRSDGTTGCYGGRQASEIKGNPVKDFLIKFEEASIKSE